MNTKEEALYKSYQKSIALLFMSFYLYITFFCLLYREHNHGGQIEMTDKPVTLFFGAYTPVLKEYFKHYTAADAVNVFKYAAENLTEDFIIEHIKKYQSVNLKNDGKKNISSRGIAYKQEFKDAFDAMYSPFKEKFFRYQVMSAALELWVNTYANNQ